MVLKNNKKGQAILPIIWITVALLVGGTIIYTQISTTEFNVNDVSITFCNDNQVIDFNSSLEVGWKEGNTTRKQIGAFQESRKTYNDYPECISQDWITWNNGRKLTPEPSYEVNMTCLIQQCNSIVTLNQLNGTITEIWKKGDIW